MAEDEEIVEKLAMLKILTPRSAGDAAHGSEPPAVPRSASCLDCCDRARYRFRPYGVPRRRRHHTTPPRPRDDHCPPDDVIVHLSWHKLDLAYWKKVRSCASAVDPADFPSLVGLKRVKWRSSPELNRLSRSCSQEAQNVGQSGGGDLTVAELAAYFEDFVVLPKAMSEMAEAMYA